MTEEKSEQNVSLFSRSADFMDADPLEEIFALNLGDFLSEHLISDDLAQKISKGGSVDKIESLKNQLQELTSIYSIDNTLKILGFTDKEDYVIYNSIAKTIKQMLEVDACQIFLAKEYAKGLDKADNDLVLVGSSLNFRDDIYSHNIGYSLNDKSLVTKAFTDHEIIETFGYGKGKEYTPILKLKENKVDYCVAVPMYSNLENVGVIVIQNHSNKKVNKEFVELVHVTAKLFATSFALQKLTEETEILINNSEVTTTQLQHHRAELTAVIGDLGDEQQMFVENMAKAVDAKSNFKANHSKEVADLARDICSHLGLNEKTKDLIYYAALLRNIGKITIPQELFNKKEKLSREDWEKLQNHPNIGVNLLMSINFLSEVVPYIHYHKERWDGKGKPEGLSGYSIPLGSRIVAIADAFCALLEKRTYRDALSVKETLDVIHQESQIKWDPCLVDALIQIKNK
ncbi:MAG: HD domain-containing protein [Candidatus Gastranaerophilales bacterium]|nr:HD domain-containing protein [Candidatus Gastranaerophilales bacterium]